MRVVAVVALLLAVLAAAWAEGGVELRRLPDGGVQSRAVVDAQGRLHVVYFSGEPKGGDLQYVTSTDGGRTWSEPRRVNSVAGSAVARGNVRGPQLAVGDGRVHVAWNGAKSSPGFLYARLDPGAAAFTPQRAMQGDTADIDGGGDVVCRGRRVWLAWHAVPLGATGRRVFVRSSADGGATFEEPRAVSDAALGCCECCGLRAAVDGRGTLYVLYRAAKDGVERDIWCLTSRDGGRRFEGRRLHGWHVAGCPVSTMSLSATGEGVVAAWETEGQIWLSRVRADGPTAPQAAAGGTGQRRHPVVCQGRQGVLLAWIEGMTYGKPGRLAWQVFDDDLQQRMRMDDAGVEVPAWDLLAAFAARDRFTLLY